MPLPRVDNPAPLMPNAPTTRAFDKLLHVLAYLCHTIDTITTEVRAGTHKKIQDHVCITHLPLTATSYKVEQRHLPMLACLGRVAAPPSSSQDQPPSLVLEHHIASVRLQPPR